MKRKLLSNLITIVFSLSFITTSFPVQSAEENQTSNTISTNDEEHKFGNCELTEEEEDWKNEHVVDITDKINEELTTKQAKRNFRGALSDDSSIMYKEENGIVDLSKTPYFPEIENQKSIGSCTAFAATYYQMSYAVNKKLNNSLENRITLSPKFTYNVTNGGTDNGSTAIKNYRFMQKYGCLSIKDYSYDGEDFCSWPTDAETWRKAQKYSIADNGIESVDLTSKDNPNYVNIDAVKLLLQKGYILNFSTYMNARVGTNIQVDNTSQYIVYYSNTVFSGRHALTVVGYNDNIAVDINQDGQIEDNERGALKIANSWGADDNNNGFFWLSYDALNKVSKVSENTKDTSKNDFINNRKPFFDQNEVTFILCNNGTESTLAEDTTDSIIKFTPKSSGNYLFKVIVKDPQTKNIINNYNISSSINTFKNGQYLTADSYNINLGDSLKIDTNFNKVDGFYYEFTAASNNGSKVNIYSGNNSSIDWKPNTSGKYLVSVKISIILILLVAIMDQ